MALNLSVDNFEQEIKNSDIPVLVDFWAPWCGPCRMVAPVVDELAEEQAGKVKVCKVNTDENMPLAEQFGILTIPAFILFKNGESAARLDEMPTKEALEAFIKG